MKIRKAVIPAAGLGTRFLPATKALPKEMLVVVDKPLIQYSVEEAVKSGLESIAIITRKGKESIEDHFGRNTELENFLKAKEKLDLAMEVRRISELATFIFIHQDEALGLGHAILLARNFIENEPFAVLLPDDIFDCLIPCTLQLIKVFEEFQSPAVVLAKVGREETKKYGIIKPVLVRERVYKVLDAEEKPEPERAFSDLGIVGRYVFTPEIFEAIKRTHPDMNGEIQITDAIKILSQEQDVYGYLFEGRRYDAGDKAGFLRATLELGLKDNQFRKKIRDWLKEFKFFCL